MEDAPLSQSLGRRQSSLAKEGPGAAAEQPDADKSGQEKGQAERESQMGKALVRKPDVSYVPDDAKDLSVQKSEDDGPSLERRNSSMSNVSLERQASRGSVQSSGSRPGSRGSVGSVEGRPPSRGSVQSMESGELRPGSRGSTPLTGTLQEDGSRRTGGKGPAKRKPSMEELMTGVNWTRGLVVDNDPHVKAHLRSHISAGALECVRKLRFGDKRVVGRGLKGMYWSEMESTPGARSVPGWLRRQRSTLPGSRAPWLILEGNNGSVCVWARSGVDAFEETVAGQFVSMVAEEGDCFEEEEEEEQAEPKEEEEEEEDKEEEEEEEEEDEDADEEREAPTAREGEETEEGKEEQQRVQVEDAKEAGWNLEGIVRSGQRVSEPTTDEGWHRIAVSPIEEALVAISDGRVLELWKGNTPEPGPTGVRRNGKTGKIVWERVAMFVEHVDIIRAVGWREDGRLLASCDLGGTVKLWARAGDHGISRAQKMAIGTGGWVCVETVHLTSDDGVQSGAGTLCFGTGPCKRYMFVGTEDETVWVLDTEGLAPFHHVPTASMAAGMGITQI